MPWFRVDDNFPYHAKVMAAGNAAVGLWTRAGAWSMQQLTDGYIPAHVVRALGTPSEARRLVEVGLWKPADDGGYVFHEWEGRQPSREQVESERQAARDRQRRAREAAASRRESQAKSRRDSDRSSPVSHGPPDPTRPDPIEQPGASTAVEREFEQWYDAYPRKRGRGQALRAYRTARKKVSAEELRNAVTSQTPALTSRGPEFVPYPATWLNGERWDDQPDSNVRALRPDDQGRVLLPPLPPTSPFGPS